MPNGISAKSGVYSKCPLSEKRPPYSNELTPPKSVWFQKAFQLSAALISMRIRAGKKLSQGSRILQRVQIPQIIKHVSPKDESPKRMGMKNPPICPKAPETSRMPVSTLYFFRPYLSNSSTIFSENKQESP